MKTLTTQKDSASPSGKKARTEKSVPPETAVVLPFGSIPDVSIQLKPVCTWGGGCPRSQKAFLVQTKLKIGRPNDKYEQEVDRVADQVMRILEPSPMVQRQAETEEEEESLQAKDASGRPPQVSLGTESVIHSLGGMGDGLN
jgi:hypothetical protein